MLFKRERRGGHAVRVTSESEIKWFLDNHEVQNGHARATDGSHYYWLTTERPSAEAVDRQLNRAFGKPVEQHAFTGEGEDGKPTTVRFVVVGGEDDGARCS